MGATRTINAHKNFSGKIGSISFRSTKKISSLGHCTVNFAMVEQIDDNRLE